MSTTFFCFSGGFFTIFYESEPAQSPAQAETLRRCSFCAAPLTRDDGFWRLNGRNVCRFCFPAFAERELAPFYIPPEEGDEWK